MHKWEQVELYKEFLHIKQRRSSMPFTPKTPYLTTDGIIELYEGDTLWINWSLTIVIS